MAGIRILLVDEHLLFREGLRQLIAEEADMEVVGGARTSQEALAEAIRLVPDVVIIDVELKQSSGIRATFDLVEKLPQVKVLALSGHTQKSDVMGMLDAGAGGYVLKTSAYEDLRKAIEVVHSGQMFLSPEIAGTVVQAKTSQGQGIKKELSERECEIVTLLTEGLSSGQVANQLRLATSTVETHRKNIMKKLCLSSVPALTKFAVREGLTTID